MIQRAWWPAIHVVSAMLAVMSVMMLPTLAHHLAQVEVMENFGSPYRSHTWVVAAPPSQVDSAKLTATVLEVAQQQELSFGYSADPEGGLVQVFDSAGLFGMGHSAYAALSVNSGERMASRALSRVDGGTSAIPATDRFYGENPALITAVSDGSLGPGYYIFTGGPAVDWGVVIPELNACWQRFGLETVFEESWTPAGAWSRLASAKVPALIVATIFVLVPWLALLLIGKVHLASTREMCLYGAVAGATSHRLLGESIARGVGSAVLGGCLGTVFSWGIMISLLPTADPSHGFWFAVTAGGSCLVASLMAAINSGFLIRAVRREVVC